MNTDPLERRLNGHALGDFRPLPLAVQPDEQALAARAEADALLAEANRMHRQAEQDAGRITTAARREVEQARGEAQRVRDEAQAAADKKAERGAFVDEWGPRVALFATIALTASGEFALAQLAGWSAWIAWALPTAIDVYVVQAFRRHRDVPGAIILMVAANAIYHLAERGLFGVAVKGGEIVRNANGEPRPEWWLIVGVAAIAPWVMWRIHRITAPPKERVETAPAERQQAPAPVQIERVGERPQPEPKALTERPVERAQLPAAERPSERPSKPKSERRERAQAKPKASADKSVVERRRERARRLYDELGKRPEWTEIRDALVADKLAPKAISRPTCQRIRDAIEKDEPALAALGSDNVRPLTGS